MKYKLLLTFLFILSLNALELTKPLMLDMSRTYGYVTSQELIVDKLKKKYPSEKYKLNKAQREFEFKFKSSMDNIEKQFGKDWKKIKKIIDPKLFSQMNNINLDKSYKNGFANEIFERTKGNVESPVIETLLMFNPKYQELPSLEFRDGFKKRLFSKDNLKAKGVNFQIDVPQSWKVKKGKRPNTLWLTTYQNGYLPKDNSQVSFGVIVRKLPEKIDTITQNEAEEFCSATLKGTPIKECMKTTLENLPTIYARNTMIIERLRFKTTIESANYFIFYKDRMILLQGMVNNVNNILSQKQLNKKFDKYLPLFDQIANSLVINDIYTEIPENTTKYYIYELFDNKFQAIFPDTPSIQEMPNELLDPKTIMQSLPYEYIKQLSKKQIDKILADTIEKMKNSQPYIYTDVTKQISYISQTMPSGLEHKNYIWSGIKNILDKQLKDVLRADNRTVIDFSSSLDKYNDEYVAIYTSSLIMDGQKVYFTTKHIYYKDKVYKWTVSYVNEADKTIFDEYQHNVKILN